MTTPKPPSELPSHLGYWLRIVSNAVSQSFARGLEDEGVTVAEWVFLRVLYDVEPLAPSALAGRMGMTKGAISKLADRLAGKGFIERRADPNDGRGQSLALLPKGRGLVPRLAGVADRNDASFFDSLSSAEREALQRLLQKIASARGLKGHPTD